MADEHLLPELALVSPARRARETWDIIASRLGAVPVRFDPRIYEAPPEQLMALIGAVEATVRTLLLVGHNPSFEDLAKHLVGHGDRYAFARLAPHYPPAGLAVIDFPVEDWRGVARGGGRLDRFVTPKSLGHEEG
jgi:phosphohistidine phosphatase